MKKCRISLNQSVIFAVAKTLRCWFERVLTYFSFGLLPPSGVAERPLGQGRTHHFHFPAWDAREEPTTTTSSSCSTLVSVPHALAHARQYNFKEPVAT